MPRYAWTKADLVGASLVWILDLTYAGRVVRIAGYPVDVSSADGTLAYSGGLGAVRVTEGFDLFADEATGAQASMEVLFPVDVPALVASGYDLASATGELSQLRTGDAWEDRRVVLVGRLVDPSHGRAGEPVRFTLKTEVWEDSGQIPESGAVVQDGTFYSAAFGGQQGVRLNDDDIGQPYPVIIGRPGYAPQTPDGFVAGSRAVWANKSTLRHVLVIAGHAVEAAEVWLNCDGRPDGQVFAVSVAYDDRGRLVSVVSDSATASGSTTPRGRHTGLEEGAPFSTPADFQPAVDDGADFFAGWATGGGVVGSSGTAIRGAGDVLEWALSQTSLQVDFGKVRACSRYLNRFLIDTSIEDFTAPMEWVKAHLLPLLPVSMATGPTGLFPILWRYDATSADAVGHLDADTDPRITIGRVEHDNSEIRNSFTLRFGYSQRAGVFQSAARIGPAYVAAQGYARGRLYQRENDGSYIDLRAVSRGAPGAVVWTLSSTGALSVIDGVGSVAFTHSTGVTTLSQLATQINSSSALITASVVGDGTQSVGGGAYATSGVLVWQDGSTMADPYCSASAARLKTAADNGIRAKSMDTYAVYEETTAYAILGWMARAFAFAQRTIAATIPEGAWGWIDRGDVLTVTDATQGLSAALAFVQEVERGGDGLIGLRLRIIEDPFRDRRS